MEKFFSLYEKFLSLFPENWHGIVSLAVVIGLIYFILKFIRQNLLWVIIALVIFFPVIYGSLGLVISKSVEIVKYMLFQ